MKALFASCICLLAITGCGADTDSSVRTADLREAEAFDAFPIYSVGASAGSLPLEFSGPGPGSGEEIGRAWSFVYGSCEATDDSGCAPPLEIQNWSICTRFPALYSGEANTKTIGNVETLRAGGGLDVYTGRSTVVIFGRDAVRLVRSLTPVNRANRELRPPVPGALDGKLPCQAERLKRFG